MTQHSKSQHSKSQRPNPDVLLARVEEDMARGELRRARRRLWTWVQQFPHERRVPLRLAQWMPESEDGPGADRYACLGGSMDEAHQPWIARHLACYSELSELRKQIKPPLARSVAGDPIPLGILDAIEARGLDVRAEIAIATKPRPIWARRGKMRAAGAPRRSRL